MSAGALNNRQFYNEQALMEQGNTQELDTRVRGLQNMTSNIYRPSFSQDYTSIQANPSPASAGRPTGGEVEEDEDEEA
jgi:hypothetical protein